MWAQKYWENEAVEIEAEKSWSRVGAGEATIKALCRAEDAVEEEADKHREEDGADTGHGSHEKEAVHRKQNSLSGTHVALGKTLHTVLMFLFCYRLVKITVGCWGSPPVGLTSNKPSFRLGAWERWQKSCRTRETASDLPSGKSRQ